MKRFSLLPLLVALAIFTSCGQQQTEAERNAEVERQVQQRLATEKQAADQARLAQTQADLDAREQALAAREAATATPTQDVTMAQTSGETEPTTTTRRPVHEPAAKSSEHRTSASYGTFYRKLETHGAWLETNDYGYVWQPKVAEESRSWRPYTEGHWVYTNVGWTWISDEPFGWATYHYGRWVRLKHVGWCWVPGEEWAPAWVSWRSSNEYVGWAPLPPEARFDRRSGIHDWADNYYDIGPEQYAFVSANELGSDRLSRAVVPAERNVTIVNETRNVTNITYNNTTIVNGGPSYEEFRTRGTRPIERYQLETRTDISDESSQPIVRGERISIAAPVIGVDRGYERPISVRERITNAVVEDGWAAITDRSAAERARAKMKSEATPPPNAPPRTYVKPTATAAGTPAPLPSASATALTTPATTSTPTATPISTAQPTEGPSATPRPTQRPRATPVPTPEATATPRSTTPSPTPGSTATPSPASTPVPTATPRASRPPRPENRATSAPTTVPVATPASTPLESASPVPNTDAARLRDERHQKETDAKAAAQQQKQAADAARKLQKDQEQQARRAEQERRANEIRNIRQPAPASTPAPAGDASASASTPAAEVPQKFRHGGPRTTPLTTPTPAAETNAEPVAAPNPPSAVVTPPPSEASTDVRRHERGPKGNPRRAIPAAPAAAAQQAEPNAAADAAAATPVTAPPAAEPAHPQADKAGKKNKNRRPNEPKPIDGAASSEPAGTSATPVPQQ